MKNVPKSVAVAAVSILLAVAAGLVRAQDDESAIKYRQSIMRAIAGHTGAMALIAKGQVPHQDQLKAHAEALAAVGKMVAPAFKQETMGGKTRAKDAIWSDWNEFDEYAGKLADATAAAAAAVRADQPVGPKMEAIFDACKACHKEFREKD